MANDLVLVFVFRHCHFFILIFQLPQIAKGIGKKPFKMYIEMFFDSIFYSLVSKRDETCYLYFWNFKNNLTTLEPNRPLYCLKSIFKYLLIIKLWFKLSAKCLLVEL